MPTAEEFLVDGLRDQGVPEEHIKTIVWLGRRKPLLTIVTSLAPELLFALNLMLLVARFLVVALTLFGFNASAADWFCEEAASQRDGNVVRTCGIGEARWEATARAQALETARLEFNRLCDLSSDCYGRPVSVRPGRTSCKKSKVGFQCHRLFIFTIDPEMTIVRERPRQVREGEVVPILSYMLSGKEFVAGPKGETMIRVPEE